MKRENTMSSRSLKIFVTGDSPRSLKKVTLFNWSGYAYLGNKSHKKQLDTRAEVSSTGLYFLFSDPKDGLVQIYIGETDNFSNRIKNHITQKDWWEHFIVFQAYDTLNKAHVKYLEKVFWDLASGSPQLEVKNDSQPTGSNLSEEDIADLEIFKNNILYVLEAMNIAFFQRKTESTQVSESSSNLYKTNALAGADYSAFMETREDSYVLKKGSYICLKAKDSFEGGQHSYFVKWTSLVNSSDVKKVNDEIGTLERDLEFTSPSVCGSLVKARSTNGLTTWKNVNTGKMLKEELSE